MPLSSIPAGSRLVATKGLHGAQRRLYIFSPLLQAAKPLKARHRKRKGPTVMRRWMLIQVTQLDPQGKLNSLIAKQQWHDAFKLAEQYQLSPDDAYKSVPRPAFCSDA